MARKKLKFVYRVYLQPLILDGETPSVEVVTSFTPRFEEGYIMFGDEAMFNKMLVRNVMLEAVA